MSAVSRAEFEEGAGAGQSTARKATLFRANGEKASIDLPGEIFAVELKTSLVHESVRSRLAAVRAGTHSTKTRGEVRGGGVKPWRQKGTGRARHGSIREPQWVGGGVAHGPKPRKYNLRVNKKAKAAALKSALSDRAGEGRVVIVEMPSFDAPKTRRAVELLGDWGVTGKALVVFGPEEQKAKVNAWKSFRNLPLVLPVTAAAPYTVLEAETVVITTAALETLSSGAADSDQASSGEAGPGKGESPESGGAAAQVSSGDVGSGKGESPKSGGAAAPASAEETGSAAGGSS